MSKRLTARIAKDIFLESLLALRDNRLRTILSILGITVGIAAVMAVSTVSKGGRYIIFSELETFGLKSVWVYRDYADKDPRRAIRTGTGIENADYTAIREARCPSVDRITPVVYALRTKLLVRIGNKYANAQVNGVGADYLEINNDSLIYGRPFREEDITRNRQVAVIGTEISTDLFGPMSNPVNREIRVGEKKFTVIGVLTPKSRDFLTSIGSTGGQDANNRLLIPYALFQQMTSGDKDINVIQAQATAVADAPAAVSQIMGILKHRHGDRFAYKSQTMAQYIKTTDNILNWVTLIGVVAASVSLFVGGMGIMNIMSTSVLERTREIGIRKALGASRREILLQFLLEAILVSAIGGALGLLLGIAAGYALVIFTHIPLAPSGPMVLVSVMVSIGVGLISGYYPAHRAANLKPVEALRFE
jgi:putative ABC transport system permease protein